MIYHNEQVKKQFQIFSLSQLQLQYSVFNTNTCIFFKIISGELGGGLGVSELKYYWYHIGLLFLEKCHKIWFIELNLSFFDVVLSKVKSENIVSSLFDHFKFSLTTPINYNLSLLI